MQCVPSAQPKVKVIIMPILPLQVYPIHEANLQDQKIETHFYLCGAVLMRIQMSPL